MVDCRGTRGGIAYQLLSSLPFLFIIVAEGLSGLVREAKKGNLFSGWEVGRERVQVDLLQFADDTIFFCKLSYDNVLAIKAILRIFELVSGHRINFHKSKVGLVGISHLDRFIYSKCLNCCLMEIPFKYLHITVGGNPKRSNFLSPIVDKIKSRLSK